MRFVLMLFTLAGVAVLATGLPARGASTDSKPAVDTATANPVMLYVGDDCSLMEWKAADRKSVLLHDMPQCPQRLYVQKNGSATFLVYKHSLTVLKLNHAVSDVTTMPLPAPDFPKKCQWPSVPFAQYKNQETLEIVIECTYPTDAMESYLYARKDNKWVFKRHMKCGRFDECNVAGHLTDGFYGVGNSYDVSWRSLRQLWTLKKSGNPYLTGAQYKRSAHPGWTDPTRWTAKFNFDGVKSTLKFTILYGEDVGTPVGSVGISLRTDDGRNVTICKFGCTTNLLGRYLILYRYLGKGDDLIDLSTGKTVLKGMKFALWRN